MTSATLNYASPKPAPPPVQGGLVIRRSVSRTFIGLCVYALLFLFGAFLIWAKLKHVILDPASSPKQVSVRGFLIGILAVVATPLASYQLLRALWRRQRLVIAADRLQIIERASGEDVVTTQIPFANVADVRYLPGRSGRSVGVDLRDVDDPDTYPDAAHFKGLKQRMGRHFIILGGYTSTPRAIAAAIERAYTAWGGQLGPTGTGANLSDAGPTTAAKVLSLVAVVTCLVPLVGLIMAVLAMRAARRSEGWPTTLNLLSLIIGITVTVTVGLIWLIGL